MDFAHSSFSRRPCSTGSGVVLSRFRSTGGFRTGCGAGVDRRSVPSAFSGTATPTTLATSSRASRKFQFFSHINSDRPLASSLSSRSLWMPPPVSSASLNSRNLVLPFPVFGGNLLARLELLYGHIQLGREAAKDFQPAVIAGRTS